MTYLAQAQQNTPNPLVPNATELIIGTVCFFIVLGVLAKLLLPRIQKTLEDRTNAIEGGLERAEEAQAQASQLLEQYRAQLADARHEAARLREEARQQGAQIIAEMRTEGEAQRQRLIDSAEAQIQAERQQAPTCLRTAAWSVSCAGAGSRPWPWNWSAAWSARAGRSRRISPTRWSSSARSRSSRSRTGSISWTTSRTSCSGSAGS